MLFDFRNKSVVSVHAECSGPAPFIFLSDYENSARISFNLR